MKSKAAVIARINARRSLLINLSNLARQSPPWIGLDFLNPSRLPSAITKRHASSAITGQPVTLRGAKRAPPLDDTIYAVSTAPGRAGIAIIRISGSGCLDVYRAICPMRAPPTPRYAALRTLYQPKSSKERVILDTDALVLYFPAPKTVTGESMLEFHVHGGPATVKAVLKAIDVCSSASKIRYAEPGEFTRRAFQNDRLDLAQVEALSDTLSAETEQQRRAAVRGNFGALGRTYENWRKELLEGRGELEALIDFSEDHDFSETDPDLLKNVRAVVQDILNRIEKHKEGGRRGEMLRKGIRISMLGPPNAGKSSLLNRIVGREASIVSDERGTTRDIVEASLDISGYLCTFADTAGLRSSVSSSDGKTIIGKVEEEGIRRAKAKAAESDLIIVMTSLEPCSSSPSGWNIHFDAEALEIAQRAEQYVVVINKTDMVSQKAFVDAFTTFKLQSPTVKDDRIIAVSCKPPNGTEIGINGDGNIASLIAYLSSSFKSLTTLGDEDLYGVTERQRQLLEECERHLKRYLEETTEADMERLDFDMVVAAEELRAAGATLGRLTGRGGGSDVEEVLGVVFEKFCVGK